MCAPRMSAWLLALVALAAACGDDDGGGPDAQLIHGCPSLTEPQASPGDPIDGDTLASFAMPMFAQYCTRCHSSTLSGDDRNGAPVGFDWDVEASIRAELPRIRNAVGVFNFMPVNDPLPSCEERQRLVRWIDAGAP